MGWVQLICASIFLTLTFDASFAYNRSELEAFKQKCRRLKTPLYASGAAPHPYKTLGLVEAGGTDFKHLYCRVRSRADELGADAIVDVSVDLVKQDIMRRLGEEGAFFKFRVTGNAVKWE